MCFQVIEGILKDINKGKSHTSTERRDSLSIFEQVNEANNSPVIDLKPKYVVKAMSIALILMNKVLDEGPPLMAQFSDQFVSLKYVWSVLSRKFSLNQLLLLLRIGRTELFSSLDQLIKIKQYTVTFKIMQFISFQQAKSSKLLISKDTRSLWNKKIIRSALQQKEPNFHCRYSVGHNILLLTFRTVHRHFADSSCGCRSGRMPKLFGERAQDWTG